MKKMKKNINESGSFLYNNPEVSNKLFNDPLSVYRVISSDGDIRLVKARDKFDAESLSGFGDILAVEKIDEVAEDVESDKYEPLYKLFVYDTDYDLVNSEELEKNILTKYEDKDCAIENMKSLIKSGRYSVLILKAFYPDNKVRVVHEELYEKKPDSLLSFDEEDTIKFNDLAEELFVEGSRRLNYDDDLIEVTLNNKEIYKGMAEDWIDDSFNEDFVWIPAKGYYEAHNDKGVWTVRVIRADDLNPLGETLTETYDEDELSDFKDKIFNIQKIENIYRRKKYGEKQLFARCTCTKCGREKKVFLSNLINDPEKYGSCICSDNYIDSKIDKISKMYSNKKKLSSNTSGYTGVSYVKSYGGEPYNKWRAYIEIDGKRNYLGDFTSKNDAIEARKEAGEKGIKWYRENRSKLIKDVRRRTKKTDKSKYRDTTAKVSVLKKDEKEV